MTQPLSLTDFLLELSARSAAEGLDADLFKLHVRRDDLADHLGLTLGGLARAIERLEFHDLIAVHPGDTIEILDRAGLERGATRAPASATRAAPPPRSGPDGTGPARPVIERRNEYALQAILADERFLAARHVSALLVFLVEKLSADGTEHVAATRRAVEVLGSPAGFDVEDPELRELVARLRESLVEYDARHAPN